MPPNLKNFDGTLMSDGYAENIEFVELTYQDPNLVSRRKAFKAIAPLLWMKVGAVGPRIEKETPDFALPVGSRYGILFGIDHWRTFADAVAARPNITHAYIVTDSLAQYQQVVAELPPQVECSMLYEDYLRNFEINTGGLK